MNMMLESERVRMSAEISCVNMFSESTEHV